MISRNLRLGIVLSLSGIVASLATVFDAGAQPTVDFARDIQPILAASCYRCHSAQNPMGELRLDDRASAMRVIVSGKSGSSRIVDRITGAGGEPRMPLGAPALREQQIALIRKWIDEGALWPDTASTPSTAARHWAFVAPVRPTPPKVSNEKWVTNPIDRFVLARLEKEGIAPSPQVDRVTLLRRLSLDLVGLPPTIEEVDAFLRDRSQGSYQKQIERLLASVHYGERWGRHWLDAARYADSDGYEKDKLRQVWFYRDWVIKALNEDKRYDQFVIEQIAGDLLPGSTQDQRVATGFLRNSMINEEGGIDPEQFRMEAIFDRMDAIGKSVLGITIQCAQCHDHKYEPLKHEEYYRMFAFLNNSHEANTPVYTPAEEMKRAEIMRVTREIETDLRHRMPDWKERMSKWEDTHAKSSTDWVILQPTVEDISTGGQRYLPMGDGSFLAQGYAPTKHRVKMEAKTGLATITGFRLELMTDPNLPLGGPGRSIKGTGALTEFEVEISRGSSTPIKPKIAKVTSDLTLPETELEPTFDDKSKRRRVTGPIEFAIDGKDETAWGIDAGPGRRNQSRQGVFALEKAIALPADAVITIYLKQNHGGDNSNDNQNNNLGRIRLAVTATSNPIADPVPARLRELFAIPRDQRSQAQLESLFSYWRTTVAEWSQQNTRIDELWKAYPEGSSQLVVAERAARRETHVLKRGDFLNRDRVVEAGVPAFLHSLDKATGKDGPGRLDFARWLVDRRSPTTARSIVNRIWQSYFGTGLVRTSEDFGRQSERPTHPELLDWLAVEFMENGWSLKHIHRLIVSSSTYRQSSTITPALLARDPENRLLARGSRFRVEAEIVRDIALSTSGLLNPKVGGPSVFPPSPEFLYLPPASYGTKVWPVETGENRYRRALYTFRYRSVPYPMLQTFDAPPADVSCVRRARSNTPLQALVSLNEPLSLEASRALALKTVTEGGIVERERVIYAFRRVVARSPSISEQDELLGLLARQKQRFVSGQSNPWNLATNDPDKSFKLPKGVTMEDLGAWTAVSRVLLNLDETITRE